jgi:hypothetical protein
MSRQRQRRAVLMAAALIFGAGVLARLGERAGDVLWDTRYAPYAPTATVDAP